MRELKLYLDSKLKTFTLFKSSQDILDNGHVFINEDDSILDKNYAINLYKDFVDIAKEFFDFYNNWGEAEWSNFITMMTLAFKEKGKESAIECALSAYSGLKLEKDESGKVVTIKDEWVEKESGEKVYCTVISFTVTEISSPFTTIFKDKFCKLLPRLYWIHELKSDEIGFENIIIDANFNDTYNVFTSKCIYRYSFEEKTNTSINNDKWRI